MNIPRMPGMGGGNPGAPAGDTPQVDTAEQVQISSLALLKMLKHGEPRYGERQTSHPIRPGNVRARACVCVLWTPILCAVHSLS